MIDSIYKFQYVPLDGSETLVRYIDLDQIVAVGMFVDEMIIGVQIDCKQRDAPLVIEIIAAPALRNLEIAKVHSEMNKLVDAWSTYKERT